MTTIAAKPAPRVMLKHSCGLCASKHHELCPGAIWNPGTDSAKWCPCTSTEHTGPKRAKCRVCGAMQPADELSEQLTCLAANDCRIAAAARTEANPLYKQLQECQTTTVVAGEVKERPRRPTPAQRDKARAEKKAVAARPCTCGCEGTTKGGAFLPGHDARFVSALAQDVTDTEGVERRSNLAAACEKLAQFPALLAKFEKRIA